MDQETRAALTRAAQDISDVFGRLAAELGASGGDRFGPTSMRLPIQERILRQSLILDDIVSEGGVVAKERWYEIAAKYGYAGRGLAGFFREGSNGLLEMRSNGKVAITRHGKERLAQNRGRVQAARESAAQE